MKKAFRIFEFILQKNEKAFTTFYFRLQKQKIAFTVFDFILLENEEEEFTKSNNETRINAEKKTR